MAGSSDQQSTNMAGTAGAITQQFHTILTLLFYGGGGVIYPPLWVNPTCFSLNKKNLDQNLYEQNSFYPKNFLPKKFYDPKNVDPNFFDPKSFFTQQIF